MRKILSFFAFVAIMISFAACGGKDGNVPVIPGGDEEINVPEGFVDLGLPSKTLWHSNGEMLMYGAYSFCENQVNQMRQKAETRYAEIPTRADWDELRNECTWQWDPSYLLSPTLKAKAYRVIGPNGKNILLLAIGKKSSGVVEGNGTGFYWIKHDRNDLKTAVQFGGESDFQFYQQIDSWGLCYCWVYKQP